LLIFFIVALLVASLGIATTDLTPASAVFS
jgi:hypothetical protein